MNTLVKHFLHKKWLKREADIKKQIAHYNEYPFANRINCEIKKIGK